MSLSNGNSFTNRIVWILSSLAVLAYAIVALYGLEYLMRGNHLVTFGVTIAGCAMLGICLWGMCKCKISRHKHRAIALGILAFLGVASIFFVGSWPFTLSMYAIDNEEELSALISNTRDYAMRVDSLYHDYAETRVAKYELLLKERKLERYERERRVNSLRRRILMPANESIRRERKEWLESLSTKNVVKNISTAKNLKDVFYAADKWIEEYRLVSAVKYEGEDAVPFSCEEYTSDAKEAYKRFCVLRKPEWRSITAMFGCIAFILLTYFVLWRPKSRYSSHR